MFVWWVLKNTVTTWYQIKPDPVCEPSFLWNELIDKSVCYWLLHAGLTIWQIVVHFNEKRPLAFIRLFWPFCVYMYFSLITLQIFQVHHWTMVINHTWRENVQCLPSEFGDALQQRSWPYLWSQSALLWVVDVTK